MLAFLAPIRSFLFYCLYAPMGILFATLAILLLPLPFRVRNQIVLGWNRISVWWLKVICGVRYEILGADNVPEGPYVVLAKHQSPWETLLLQYYFAPLSTILKRELLKIPFFGWGLATLKPIAIDRSKPREALKQIKALGLQRLDEGNNILVFPEGTRIPAGQVGKYARGGADIACSAGVPVVPVAHNAGFFWPAHTFVKHPGTITVAIGKPIDTKGKNSREVTEQVQGWIEEQLDKMPTTPPQSET